MGLYCFFPSLHVSFNMGLNVAFWNMHERKITSKTEDNIFLVNEEFKLVFFHFSSFNDKELTKRPFGIDIYNENLLQEVISQNTEKYFELLKSVDKKYSYDYMEDGKYIAPTLRRAYASVLNEFSSTHNPFSKNGEVHKFADKNYLFEKKNITYKAEGFDEVKNYSTAFTLIYKGLKSLLYLVGPVIYQDYLSSYRQINNLWKLPKEEKK